MRIGYPDITDLPFDRNPVKGKELFCIVIRASRAYLQSLSQTFVSEGFNRAWAKQDVEKRYSNQYFFSVNVTKNAFTISGRERHWLWQTTHAIRSVLVLHMIRRDCGIIIPNNNGLLYLYTPDGEQKSRWDPDDPGQKPDQVEAGCSECRRGISFCECWEKWRCSVWLFWGYRQGGVIFFTEIHGSRLRICQDRKAYRAPATIGANAWEQWLFFTPKREPAMESAPKVLKTVCQE